MSVICCVTPVYEKILIAWDIALTCLMYRPRDLLFFTKFNTCRIFSSCSALFSKCVNTHYFIHIGKGLVSCKKFWIVILSTLDVHSQTDYIQNNSFLNRFCKLETCSSLPVPLNKGVSSYFNACYFRHIHLII